MTVPNFRVGDVLRTTSVVVITGGKGFNAARAVKVLGGHALNASISGGHSGRWTEEMVTGEGLECCWTPIQGETRTCLMIIDPAANDATVINQDGPQLSAQEWQRFQQDILDVGEDATLVNICGSLPPGLPPERLAEMTEALQKRGKQVWIDNRGKPLEAALPISPAGVKCNGREASTILHGPPIVDAAGALTAAEEIHRRGIANVVITLGAGGAVMVNAQGRWHVQAPAVKPVNSAGSGDTFLGGLTYVLDNGGSVREALRTAAAAGAANALTSYAGTIYSQDLQRMLAETRVVALG
jgi:1-phosphofructokinase family hexose kinase